MFQKFFKRKFFLSASFFCICTFFIAFIFFIILFFQNKNSYDIRIEAKFDNVSTKAIDDFFVEEVKDNLEQVEAIKDVVTFARDEKATIYCKIKGFNKKEAISKIKYKLENAMNKTLQPSEIYFIDDYNLKYDSFLIVSSKNNNYLNLRNFCANVLDDLLNLKIFKKILPLGEQEKTIYIIFQDKKLLENSFSLNDIILTVKENNKLQNSSLKLSSSFLYPTILNSEIENVEDIKNIAVQYKNSAFSRKFEDIFEIEEKIKTPPDYFVCYKNNSSQIFAFSKKKYIPNFVFNLILKRFIKAHKDNSYDFKLVQASSLKKIEIETNERKNVNSTYELYKKIENNFKDENFDRIYFIGQDAPKISNKEEFFENNKNKLTVLLKRKNSRKFKKFLEKNDIIFYKNNDKIIKIEDKNIKNLITPKGNYEIIGTLGTTKIPKIKYYFNNFALNDYSIKKEEAINTIFAANDGLFCDYFFENNKKIPIVLVNKNQKSNFLFSKTNNILLNMNSFLESKLEEDFYIIARKNGIYFASYRTR